MNLAHVRHAARIQLIYGRVRLLLPWAVLASSLLINIVIYATIDHSGRAAHRPTGGLASMYGTMPWVSLVAVTQVFPFAVMMSVTRWAFTVALAVLVLAESLVNGILLTVCKAVENGTGGWGVNLRFFDLPYVSQHNPVLQSLVFAAPLVVVCFLGVCAGAVFHRWGQIGVWLALIGTLLAGGLAFAALLFFDLFHAVGSFVTGQPAFAMLTVYPTLLAALVAAAAARMMLRSRI